MKKALVPIADGTEEMEAVIIIDMLRRAEIEVLTVGLSEIAHCSRDVKILPDILIDEIDTTEYFDAIVLPGGIGGTEEFAKSKKLRDILVRHKAENKTIGAICAAPTVLKKIRFAGIGSENYFSSVGI